MRKQIVWTVIIVIVLQSFFSSFVLAEPVVKASTILLQENDPRMEYEGAWSTRTGKYSGGTEVFTTEAAATVNFQFVGTGYKLIGSTGDVTAPILVSTDGNAPKSIHLPQSVKTQQTIFEQKNLSYGLHTVAISSGKPGKKATYGFNLDAIELQIGNPPSPTTFTGQYTEETVKLSWSAVNHVQGYHVYRGTKGKSDKQRLSAEPLVDTKLTDFLVNEIRSAQSVYQYAVRAVGEGGVESNEKVIEVNIPSNTLEAPKSIAAARSGNAVKVSWKATPHAAGYVLSRSDRANGPFAPIGSSGGIITDLSYLDYPTVDRFSATPITYYYRVAAINNVHIQSAPSAVVKIQMPASEGPKNLKAIWTGEGMKLSWNAVEGAAGYLVRKYDDKNKKYVVLHSTELLSTEYFDSFESRNISNKEKVKYSVVAMDTRKVETKPSSVEAIAPTNVSAAPRNVKFSRSLQGITILWDSAQHAAGYKVYRSSSNKGPWNNISGTTPVTNSTFIDESYNQLKLTIGTPMYYGVTSVNRYGLESDIKQTVKVLKTAPASPSQLKVTPDNGAMNISWEPVESAAGYRVFRMKFKGDKGHLLTSTDVVETTFSDTSIDQHRRKAEYVLYGVVAIDPSGNLSKMAIKGAVLPKNTIKPPVLLSVAATGGEVSVNWEATEGAVNYQIFRKYAGVETAVAGVVNQNSVSFTDQPITERFVTVPTSITYTVVAVDRYGVATKPSNAKTVLISPTSVPEWNQASYSNEDANIHLSWNSVPHATSYRVERYEQASDTFVPVETTTTLNLVDTISAMTLISEMTWEYRVVALDNIGNETKPSVVRSVVVPANAPTVPVGLQTHIDSSRAVTLQWAESVNAANYHVYRIYPNQQSVKINGDIAVVQPYFVYTGLQAAEGIEDTDAVFAVSAINRFGIESERSAISSITVQPPASPTNLQVAVEGDHALLSWQSTEQAAGYRIYRSIHADSGFELVIALEGEVTSYSDPVGTRPLSEDTLFYYAITAIDSYGLQSQLTPGAPILFAANRAAIPSGINLVADNTQLVTLSWDAVDRAVSYQIYRTDDQGVTEWIGSSNTNSYIDSQFLSIAINQPQHYTYQIEAVNRFGHVSNLSEMVSHTFLPVEQTERITVSLINDYATVQWTAVHGATGYRIYRSDDGGDSYQRLTEVTAAENAYGDNWQVTVENDRTIVYGVSSIGPNGVQSELTVTEALIIPSNVAQEPTDVNVIWSAGKAWISWEPSENAYGYFISRSIAGAPFEVLNKEQAINDTQYIDHTLLEKHRTGQPTDVRYSITAVNKYGSLSEGSDPVSTELPASLEAPVISVAQEEDSIVVSWTTIPNAVSYRLVRITDATSEAVVIGEFDPNTLQYQDSIAARTVTEAEKYHYHIQAIDVDGGQSEPSQSVEIIINPNIPASPTSLVAVKSGNRITLNWTAAVNNKSYHVERATSEHGPYERISTSAPLTDLTFVDEYYVSHPPVQTMSVYYRLVARNQYEAESAPSEVTTVLLSNTMKRIEDNQLKDLQYSGKWTSWNRNDFSGGMSTFSFGVNASVQMSFNGTRFEYVGFRNSFGGIVHVELDGKRIATVDTYSDVEEVQSVLFATEVSPGMHTVRIIRSGEKNVMSSGANIPFDAFLIEGHTATRIEETDPSIVKHGLFTEVNDPTNTLNKAIFTFDTKGSVTVPFYGSAIDWVGFTSPYNAYIDVYLDNVKINTVDTYSSTMQSEQKLLELNGLTNELHVLQLVRSGERNPASLGGNLIVDYFLVDGSAGQLIEHDHSSIQYQNNWRIHANAGHSNSSAFIVSDLFATAEAVFYGTSVDWYGMSSEFGGMAEVYVDNVWIGKADLYSSQTAYQQKLFSVKGLSKGAHRLKIRLVPTTNTLSKGANVSLDYLLTDGRFGKVLDQNDSSIVYSGSWIQSASANFFNNSAAYTFQQNAYAEITFVGTGISIVGFKNAYGGLQKFMLDGQIVTTVDTYNPTPAQNTTLLEIRGLQKGTHTLRILPSGTHPSSSGANINIDAVVIFD